MKNVQGIVKIVNDLTNEFEIISVSHGEEVDMDKEAITFDGSLVAFCINYEDDWKEEVALWIEDYKGAE